MLTTLPEELCLDIIDKLDMKSIIALSQTSKLFSRLADPHHRSRRPLLEKFLIESQFSPRWRKRGLACFICLRVLPQKDFAARQTIKKRGRTSLSQTRRFCVKCGVETFRYKRGNRIVQDGVTKVVCLKCNKVKKHHASNNCKACFEGSVAKPA